MGIILPLFLLLLAPLSNHCTFSIHVFRGLVQHIGHRFWAVPLDGEEELFGLQLVGERGDQDFSVSFVSKGPLC